MSSDGRPDWRTGTVVETREVAAGIRRITIERPAPSRFSPGSHLDVKVPLGPGQDTRSYSVVESARDGRLLTITVLRVAQSRGGSAHMHRLAEGDRLLTTQPLQNFPLRIGAPRYVLLAGGIGITAIVEMARVLHALKADYELVYVARGRAVMAYLEPLVALHGDRIRVHLDDEGSPLDVRAVVQDVAAGAHAAGTELYMCGPIRLMDAVRREWEAGGLPPTNLRFETFGNSGWYDPQEFLVRIPRLGLETTVGPNSTLLDALTDAGVDVMYDCRKGECGLCLVDVERIGGTLDHRDVFLSARQKATGTSLCVCVSRVVAATGSAGVPVVELALP